MSVFLKMGFIFMSMVFCLSMHLCTPFLPGACGVPGGGNRMRVLLTAASPPNR